MAEWVSVPYNHATDNPEPLWLGFTPRYNTGPPQEWVDAFRDEVNGRRVLTAPVPVPGPGTLWVKDGTGARPVRPVQG